MRRSKSNPAKYARNYRSISQRQMSQFDGLDEEQEMKRLQKILTNSEKHLKQHDVKGSDNDDEDGDANSKKKREQNKKRKLETDSNEDDKATEAKANSTKDNNKDGNDSDDEFERARALLRNTTDHLRPIKTATESGILVSPTTTEEDAMILKPKSVRKRKKKGHQDNAIVSSSLEETSNTPSTEDASGDNKEEKKDNDQKVESKGNQKTSNKDASKVLSDEFIAENLDHACNDIENPLVVLPSNNKNKKKQKAEQKKRKLAELTPEEIKEAKQLQKKTQRKLKQLATRAEQKKKRAVLYEKLKQTAIDPEEMKLMSSSSTLGKKVSKKEQLKKILNKERAGMELSEEERDLLYRDRGTVANDDDDDNNNSDSNSDADEDHKGGVRSKGAVKSALSTKPTAAKAAATLDSGKDKSKDKDKKDSKEKDTTTEAASSNPAMSFAAQMMSSLSSLKATSEKQKVENEKKKAQEEEERKRLEDERLRKASKGAPYKPSDPIIIQTAATNKKLQVHQLPGNKRRVLQVTRPKDVQESRYDLPVTQMEFEVMDAIRNNDVTIVCGETGSGKSTQVPQLLYESGFTLGSSPKDAADEGPKNQSHNYLIGVTQPRRVAAVSTAKRVCYEMGQGDGKSIKATKRSKGNLVSYQTRYETAGLGENTSVKFMTDGILLQEIQSDLLLRKYSVIILDECHERNLNCDILCGLIGLALPLRKKASEEPGSNIVPLKLVIMSATLRVDDFVKNDKLFPSTTPYVVKIPGRTFPVTIHHSKATELDNYEDVAFQKICKIHRKLPHGGILVFLTGKQEIVRMVNRLRKALGRRKKSSTEAPFVGSGDVATSRTDINFSNEGGLRDLDDDEVDGDLFQSNDDDYDDQEAEESTEDITPTKRDGDDDADDNIPKDVIVLPLYSMLSAEEQAKVFASVQEGHRLIVVSTNISETSITIPGISYVVDTGRQKCKNYDVKTGVASFDISWISKAAANQRAGRAGRTGPGHCYRLYSSSMFSRHMDDFALPEVLTRPLEDVVLAMKAMKISSISKFPFPTPPAESQIESAVKLLANLGCVDIDDRKDDFDADGQITHLGAAVATLPLGVRCGKMLLVAAHAGVLDYAIALIAAMSENSPFLRGRDLAGDKENESKDDEESNSSDDESASEQNEKIKTNSKWIHKAGDFYAVMLAIGAYTYAGKGAGGMSEKVACKQFCQENGLNHVIMERIHKIRSHLSKLVRTRMAGADGVAAQTGQIPHSMKPPNKLQERLLLQVITSSFLDNVAMLAPLGSIPGSHPYSLRSAYLSCSSSLKEPLFMDRNSVLYSRDSRRLPQWICYDYLVRKTLKDGTLIATAKNVTPVDPSWLGSVAKGSNLLSTGGPLPTPRPSYDPDRDEIMCAVETKFGNHKWEITPLKLPMYDALRTPEAKHSMHFQLDDTYRYFARFLLEGKVLIDLEGLKSLLNDNPSMLTSRTPVGKVGTLVSALSNAGVDSAAKLRKHWCAVDNKFLFKTLKSWVKPEHTPKAKKLWIDTVTKETKTS